MVSGVFSIPLQACSTPSPEAGPRGRPCRAALREYVGSDENRLVQFAVQTLLAGQRRYNPVLLCGPTGTGKTLLAEGLAERWREEHPGEPVMATCGADFARSHAYALDTNSLSDFRRRMLTARLFVLDDLQQLRQKTAAQEELARLLDLFLDRATAVLVTSSQPLDVRDGLAAGLCSRLSAGLSVPLRSPGAPARRILLRRLADLYAVPLPDGAIELLAAGPPGAAAAERLTVPQLSHAVVQLGHAARTAAAPIGLDDVRAFLAAQAAEERPSFRAIAAKAARHFGVTVQQLRGPSRASRVVRARGVAMLLARRLTGKSLQVIGQYFGQRDHTTVLHACRKTELLQHGDPAIAQAVDGLARQLTEPSAPP